MKRELPSRKKALVAAGKRRVRTTAGAKRFDAPIGAEIVKDPISGKLKAVGKAVARLDGGSGGDKTPDAPPAKKVAAPAKKAAAKAAAPKPAAKKAPAKKAAPSKKAEYASTYDEAGSTAKIAPAKTGPIKKGDTVRVNSSGQKRVGQDRVTGHLTNRAEVIKTGSDKDGKYYVVAGVELADGPAFKVRESEISHFDEKKWAESDIGKAWNTKQEAWQELNKVKDSVDGYENEADYDADVAKAKKAQDAAKAAFADAVKKNSLKDVKPAKLSDDVSEHFKLSEKSDADLEKMRKEADGDGMHGLAVAINQEQAKRKKSSAGKSVVDDAVDSVLKANSDNKLTNDNEIRDLLDEMDLTDDEHHDAFVKAGKKLDLIPSFVGEDKPGKSNKVDNAVDSVVKANSDSDKKLSDNRIRDLLDDLDLSNEEYQDAYDKVGKKLAGAKFSTKDIDNDPSLIADIKPGDVIWDSNGITKEMHVVEIKPEYDYQGNLTNRINITTKQSKDATSTGFWSTKADSSETVSKATGAPLKKSDKSEATADSKKALPKSKSEKAAAPGEFVSNKGTTYGTINHKAKAGDPDHSVPKKSLADGTKPAVGQKVRDKDGNTGEIVETYQGFSKVKWDGKGGASKSVNNNKLNVFYSEPTAKPTK